MRPSKPRNLVFGCLSLGFTLFAAANDSSTYTVDGNQYTVDWLLDESFENSDWSTRWTVESQGSKVELVDGLLTVRRGDVDKATGGVTIWLDRELPQDVIILVDASTEPGDHACNLNFFVHATEVDGSPLQYTRNAVYKEYHLIPNYLFTYTGGFMSGWTRARLNPGFQLISENKEVYAEPGAEFRFTIICDGDGIRFYVDGEKLHEFEPDEVLSGGKFGLRTWFSDINYDQVQIGSIEEGSL